MHLTRLINWAVIGTDVGAEVNPAARRAGVRRAADRQCASLRDGAVVFLSGSSVCACVRACVCVCACVCMCVCAPVMRWLHAATALRRWLHARCAKPTMVTRARLVHWHPIARAYRPMAFVRKFCKYVFRQVVPFSLPKNGYDFLTEKRQRFLDDMR